MILFFSDSNESSTICKSPQVQREQKRPEQRLPHVAGEELQPGQQLSLESNKVVVRYSDEGQILDYILWLLRLNQYFLSGAYGFYIIFTS